MKLHQHRHTVAALVAILAHLLVLLVLYYRFLERAAETPQLTEVEILPIDVLKSEAQGTSEVSALGSAVEEKPAPKDLVSSEPITKPQPRSTASPKPNSKAAPVSKASTINTQQHEESLRIAEAKRRKEAEIQAELNRQKKQQEEEAARLAAEEKRKQEERERQKAEAERKANAKIASAFGAASKSSGAAQSTGQENAGKQGGTGAAVGAGSHSLAGRSIVSNGGRLTMPSVKKAIRGRINVRIVVDETGSVTSAEVSLSGTNITDSGARSAAITAARQTEFNAQPGSGAQKGIITYNFEIQ